MSKHGQDVGDQIVVVPDVAKVYDRKQMVTERTIAWVFCGVLFALFPVYIELAKQMAASSIDLVVLLKKGEQYVVGGVVALGAVGEMLAASVPKDSKNLALGMSLGAIFAAIANLIAYSNAPSATPGFLFATTTILGIGTLIVSLICVRMAAGR